MTKLTQKERRDRKKQKCLEEPIVKEQDLECPICLEKHDKNNITKLGCGHRFCNQCMNQYSVSKIHSKINNKSIEIFAPIGHINGKLPIMTFTNDEPIIKCAVCRTEHMLITNTLKPQKVLIKIEFAMNEEGLTPTHYITDYSEILHYKPKKNYDEHKWLSILYEIIMMSKKNECNIVYVLKCKCSNKDCPDFMMCNKKHYKSIPNNFKSNLEFMKVNELKDYVITYE